MMIRIFPRNQTIPPGQAGVRVNIDMSRGWAGGAGDLNHGHRPQPRDKRITGQNDAGTRTDRLGKLHVPHVTPKHPKSAVRHGLSGHPVTVGGDVAHGGLRALPVKPVVLLR